jgi:ubiquinone biosynthesis protein UbiJ
MASSMTSENVAGLYDQTVGEKIAQFCRKIAQFCRKIAQLCRKIAQLCRKIAQFFQNSPKMEPQ